MTFDKQYHLVYRPGWAGTWLCWFINQHRDFPHYTKELFHGNRDDVSFPTDFSCAGADWWLSEGQTFDEQMIKQDQLVVNKTSTQRCFKILTEHHYPDNEDFTDPVVAELKRLPFDYNPIFATVSEPKHISILAKRWETIMMLGDDDCVPSYDEIFEFFSEEAEEINIKRNFYTKLESIASSVHYVDVGKLIFDQDENEYNKLLHHINQPQMDDWKDIITEAVELVYKRYL